MIRLQALALQDTEPDLDLVKPRRIGRQPHHVKRQLALLDKSFPNAPSRPELHAKLLEFYASETKSEAVLKVGKEFLATFPKATERTRVALLVADSDARLDKTQDEFAIYDSVLQELAAKADKMPIGSRAAETGAFTPQGSAFRAEGNDSAGGGEFEGSDAG